MAAILDLVPSKIPPTLLRETSLLNLLFNRQRSQITENTSSFALHGHDGHVTELLKMTQLIYS